MNETDLRTITQVMAQWGFGVFFPLREDRPGFRALAVAMRPRPTYRHYDPERLTLALRRGREHPEATTIHHDTPLAGTTGVGPGMVVMGDRVDKRVSFYTFGGQLETIRDAANGIGTLYVLSSPAPVLAINTSLGVGPEEQLAAAAEALLARMRARYRKQGRDPDALLSRLNPYALYTGCVESLYTRHQRSSALMAAFPDQYRLLQRERTWLQGESGGRLIALEQQLESISRRNGLTGD